MNVVDEKLETILEESDGGGDSLVPVLLKIQALHHYLSPEALRRVAQALEIPLAQVYGVAAFYKAFSLEPRGKHIISVCLGTACHVRGAPAVVDELERVLGVRNGETTPDREFTLETVNCLGACALGPIVVMDGEYHGQMNPAKTREAFEEKYGANRK